MFFITRYLVFFLWATKVFPCVIHIQQKPLSVEIADTEEKRRQGLMGRDALLDGHGMLFVFDRSKILSFWMKDTKIPLSIGFFDEKQRLIKTIDMDPPQNNEFTYYWSEKPARYALEVPKGWFQRHHIEPPMPIEESIEKLCLK